MRIFIDTSVVVDIETVMLLSCAIPSVTDDLKGIGKFSSFVSKGSVI